MKFLGCGQDSGQEASLGSRVWTCKVVEWYLERLGWSGSLCERVVSGSAPDSTVGSDTIQISLRSSAGLT
jgi:hypothetical protein